MAQPYYLDSIAYLKYPHYADSLIQSTRSQSVLKSGENFSVIKLEEERQNLLRVTDILSELEKQVGPLQKQSEVAKEYLKKKESLKTFDINMFLMETSRLKEEIASIAPEEDLFLGMMRK